MASSVNNPPIALPADLIMGLLADLSKLKLDDYPSTKEFLEILEVYPVTRASRECSLGLAGVLQKFYTMSILLTAYSSTYGCSSSRSTRIHS